MGLFNVSHLRIKLKLNFSSTSSSVWNDLKVKSISTERILFEGEGHEVIEPSFIEDLDSIEVSFFTSQTWKNYRLTDFYLPFDARGQLPLELGLSFKSMQLKDRFYTSLHLSQCV